MSAPNQVLPTVQSSHEAVALATQGDSVVNWILFDKSLPKPNYVNIYPLPIPSNLFRDRSLYCRPLFVEPLRKEYKVPTEVEDIVFWMPKTPLSMEDAVKKGWLATIGDFKASFKLIPFATSFCDNLEVCRVELVHLVITVNLPFTTKRRRTSSGEVVFDRLKRTKLATIAPSRVAQSSQYESLQQKSKERVLDDRPVPDTDIPPISLLYDGFGQFLDIVDGCSDVEGLSEVDAIELRKCVDGFANSMCGFYNDEDARRDAALPLINKIFAARKGSDLPDLRASAIGSTRTDGHCNGDHEVTITILKFKNQSTGTVTVPEIEMTGYFAHSHVAGMARRQVNFEGWRVPCLGLTIVGPDVKFYAMINLDYQFRLVGLAPSLSCILSASEGRDRNALYAAFTAASVLQARILQHVHDRLSLPVPDIQNNVHLPAITKLRRYTGDSDDFFTFRITARYPNKQNNRLLYFADTELGESIMVKFVRQYSSELHGFCAGAGHAPRLLAFQRLPGGWYGVAMDYIHGAVMITTSPHRAKKFELWKTDLQNLVRDFHKMGLVHGDLRDANIICGTDSGRVCLIDFDWGGKVGEVSYPTPNLHPELLKVRSSMSGGLKITKENDLQILENTLAKVESTMPAGYIVE